MTVLGWSAVGIGALAATAWYTMRRRVEVPCTIDLEATHDHFHAHVELDGIAVEPGDAVQVHNAPSRIAFGTQRRMSSTATIARGSWLRRQIVKLTGGTELYELYDVGFEG